MGELNLDFGYKGTKTQRHKVKKVISLEGSNVRGGGGYQLIAAFMQI